MSDDRTTGTLQALLESGWAYHDSASERLARELETAAQTGVDDGLLAPFLHLSTHTIGEHLGDWPRAMRLGKRLLDGRAPGPESIEAWGRLQVAAVLAGDAIEAAELELTFLTGASDRGAALLELRFMLIGALVSVKRAGDAARLYGIAIALLERVSVTESLARAIATVSNNLGWELYEMSARSPDEDRLMRQCADTGVGFWLQCGNWINEERARYFHALVSNALGEPRQALAEADKALAVIAAHDSRPLDTALLHLARAAAMHALGDGNGASRAIAAADTAAAVLSAPALQAQFAAQRARTFAA